MDIKQNTNFDKTISIIADSLIYSFVPNDFYYLTKILNTFKLVVSGLSCQPSSLRAYFDDDSLACSSEEFFFQQKPLVRPVFKNMINAPYKTNIYKYSAFLSERVKVGSNIYSEREIYSLCGSNSMKQFITALRKLVIHYKKVILKVGYLIPREGHQTCIKYTNWVSESQCMCACMI